MDSLTSALTDVSVPNTPYRLGTYCAFCDGSKGTECALCAQSVKGIRVDRVDPSDTGTVASLSQG